MKKCRGSFLAIQIALSVFLYPWFFTILIFAIYSTSSASCPLICASCNSFIRTLPYLVRSKPEPELVLFGASEGGGVAFSDNPEVAEVDVVSFPCWASHLVFWICNNNFLWRSLSVSLSSESFKSIKAANALPAPAETTGR